MNSISTMDESILVVDDNETNIQFLATLLDTEGYNVRAATGGEMAISAVNRLVPDLILLDVMMPEMDGYETINRIRAIPGGEQIPVIFLTAKTEEADIVKGFEEGAVDYVTKPFSSMELLARIKTHLKIRRRDKSIERNAMNQKYLLRLLAHDLAGNLSGMDSMALWASQDISDRGFELAAYVNTTVASSMELIQTVKQFMEMEINRTYLSLSETELGETVKHTITNLTEAAGKKEVDFLIDLQYEGPIRAEKITLINTVLKIILHNAVELTAQGGSISIRSERHSDFALLTISYIEELFSGEQKSREFVTDMISQKSWMKNEARNDTTGKDYGLFLAGRLLEVYGASIDIKSSPDGGAEVNLHFRIP